MTLQALATPAIWPHWPFANAEPTDFRFSTIDGANEFVSLVVRVWKAGDIRNVGFLTGTVTDTADPTALDIRIESVDGNGEPGGLLAANTNVTLNIQDGDDGQFLVTGNLTANATVARGDIIAIKILNPGADFATMQLAKLDQQENQFPYTVEDLGAGAAKAPFGIPIALQYSDGNYYPIEGVWPFSAENRNLASSPEEDGAKFQRPGPYKAIGAVLWTEPDNDMAVVIRSDGAPGSILTSKSIDKDHIAVPGGSGRSLIYFDDEIEFAGGTDYRLLIDRGGASVGVPYFSTLNADIMAATPGGTSFIRTHGTGAGAFTDVDTQTPIMSLIISAIDDGAGAGGGGLLVHPGTSGGARG